MTCSNLSSGPLNFESTIGKKTARSTYKKLYHARYENRGNNLNSLWQNFLFHFFPCNSMEDIIY